MSSPVPINPSNLLWISNNSIITYRCGQDTTCTKNCVYTSSVTTTSINPCPNGDATGLYGTADYTSTSNWNPGFKTNYFSYYTFSTNDNTCSKVYAANRTPVYPTCTMIITGIYGYTIFNPNSRNIEYYACGDAGCNTCQLVSSDSLSTACGIDSGDSESFFTTYYSGSILNDPNVVLPSTFPNQTKPTPTPTPPSPSPTPLAASSNSNIGLIGGAVAGVVVVAGIIAGYLWSRRSKNPQPQNPPALVVPVNNPAPVATSAPALPPAAATSPAANFTSHYPIQGSGQPNYGQPAYPGAGYGQYPNAYTQDYRASFVSGYAPSPTQGYAAPPYASSDHSAATSPQASYLAPSMGYAAQAPSFRNSNYSESAATAEAQGLPQTNPPAVAKHIVIAGYSPKDSQHIDLRLGDIILIQGPFINGVAQGYNQNTGRSGLVPKYYVVAIADSSAPGST
ncbi:uncharacterized protein BJ171DRAFT_576847 [Polychytrium aggregatum]|uniref:uncharacterized protein n=1 Tax=Polychytrium aggregatum TaxID=110093 RepID=UPI0022FF1FDC|nr:uncharacterized protein BJ171DRAFT_576847 [Polychytrium aggregatum]KAI9209274.1 hypothetical protein BJ171DRAFT_576847 [Polychytrium aggregatum]